MRPDKNNYVIYEGNKFQIEFYFTNNGKMPAKEYFDASNENAQEK